MFNTEQTISPHSIMLLNGEKVISTGEDFFLFKNKKNEVHMFKLYNFSNHITKTLVLENVEANIESVEFLYEIFHKVICFDDGKMSTRVRNIFIFLTRNLLPVKTTNHFNNGDKKFSYQLNKEVMTIKNINGETVYKSAFNKLSRSILKGLE